MGEVRRLRDTLGDRLAPVVLEDADKTASFDIVGPDVVGIRDLSPEVDSGVFYDTDISLPRLEPALLGSLVADRAWCLLGYSQHTKQALDGRIFDLLVSVNYFVVSVK
jgi:hypothetical protein